MTRKHCRRREIMPQPPRGLRPGLARDQQVELSIVHLSLLDTIMHGEADVGVLWQLVGCILTWSRVSEIMKLGREEMLPQLDLVTRIVQRYGGTGSISLDAGEYDLARTGIETMDALAATVDLRVAIIAAEWAESRVNAVMQCVPSDDLTEAA